MKAERLRAAAAAQDLLAVYLDGATQWATLEERDAELTRYYMGSFGIPEAEAAAMVKQQNADNAEYHAKQERGDMW